MSADQEFTVNVVMIVAGIAALACICATIVGAIAFNRTQNGAAKTFSLLIQRGSIVRLTAIIIIIFCAFTLALARIMDADLAASIFSGIAGYVLGGAPKASGAQSDI